MNRRIKTAEGRNRLDTIGINLYAVANMCRRGRPFRMAAIPQFGVQKNKLQINDLDKSRGIDKCKLS